MIAKVFGISQPAVYGVSEEEQEVSYRYHLTPISSISLYLPISPISLYLLYLDPYILKNGMRPEINVGSNLSNKLLIVG